MRVAIVGGGDWNVSAARYWRTQGADVQVYETIADMARQAKIFDLVVRSTSIHPAELGRKKLVTTEVREFFRRCPARIIGVTGSTGKAATTRYIARMLEESGKRVWRGGGEEPFLLDFLAKVKARDLVVLNLSSHQLMDLDVSPHFAVSLRINPEQRDPKWDAREYVAAQGNLFWHQRSDDVAVYDVGNDFATQIGLLSRGARIPFMETPGAVVRQQIMLLDELEIGNVDEFGLTDNEAVENACAAVTVAAQVQGVRPDAIRRALQALRQDKSV
jgi:UDP-N-acetylmuramoylalanine--D-glutamate ligase